MRSITRDISAAGTHFLSNQPPELYTAMERNENGFPVQYLGANLPQAWAAGSVFALLQAILGFRPDAPQGRLRVDPLLPEWLPDVTVLDLRLGKHQFDIRFWRSDDETRFEVLRGDPKAVVRRPFGAQFEQAGACIAGAA
jgi:glycogen debranching enzyme